MSMKSLILSGADFEHAINEQRYLDICNSHRAMTAEVHDLEAQLEQARALLIFVHDAIPDDPWYAILKGKICDVACPRGPITEADIAWAKAKLK